MASCACQVVHVTLDTFKEEQIWLSLLADVLYFAMLVCDAISYWSFAKMFYEATNLYYHLQTNKITFETSRIPNSRIESSSFDEWKQKHHKNVTIAKWLLLTLIGLGFLCFIAASVFTTKNNRQHKSSGKWNPSNAEEYLGSLP